MLGTSIYVTVFWKTDKKINYSISAGGHQCGAAAYCIVKCAIISCVMSNLLCTVIETSDWTDVT